MNREFEEILEEFRDRNPWKGTVAERVQKFAETHQQLANITNLVVSFNPEVSEDIHKWSDSGNSTILLEFDETGRSKFSILMVGRLSVLTFLLFWQILAARGTPPIEFDYLEVFKKYWPDKFSKLTLEDGMYKRIV